MLNCCMGTISLKNAVDVVVVFSCSSGFMIRMDSCMMMTLYMSALCRSNTTNLARICHIGHVLPVTPRKASRWLISSAVSTLN